MNIIENCKQSGDYAPLVVIALALSMFAYCLLNHKESKHHEVFTIEKIGTCEGRSPTCNILATDENGTQYRMKMHGEAFIGDTAYQRCWIANDKQECDPVLKDKKSLGSSYKKTYEQVK